MFMIALRLLAHWYSSVPGVFIIQHCIFSFLLIGNSRARGRARQGYEPVTSQLDQKLAVASRRRIQMAAPRLCPYCVDGNHGKPMVERFGGTWFRCGQCGHVVMPTESDFECTCRNCSSRNKVEPS